MTRERGLGQSIERRQRSARFSIVSWRWFAKLTSRDANNDRLDRRSLAAISPCDFDESKAYTFVGFTLNSLERFADVLLFLNWEEKECVTDCAGAERRKKEWKYMERTCRKIYLDLEI